MVRENLFALFKFRYLKIHRIIKFVYMKSIREKYGKYIFVDFRYMIYVLRYDLHIISCHASYIHIITKKWENILYKNIAKKDISKEKITQINYNMIILISEGV